MTLPLEPTPQRNPPSAVWAPLYAAMPPSYRRSCFMFMGMVEGPNGWIHQYKHVDTGRYLNLDGTGGAYDVRSLPSGGVQMTRLPDLRGAVAEALGADTVAPGKSQPPRRGDLVMFTGERPNQSAHWTHRVGKETLVADSYDRGGVPWLTCLDPTAPGDTFSAPAATFTLTHAAWHNLPPLATAEGVTYTPWTNGRAVGFRATTTDGREEFIYLNPSTEDDAGESNVFVYRGADGDPSIDVPLHYYLVLAEPTPEAGCGCLPDPDTSEPRQADGFPCPHGGDD